MEQKFTEHLLFGRPSVGDTEMNKEQLLSTGARAKVTSSAAFSQVLAIITASSYCLGGKEKILWLPLLPPFNPH